MHEEEAAEGRAVSMRTAPSQLIEVIRRIVDAARR